jgi:hypothetical protein
MTAPTLVWTVVAKDSKGQPRGFEKSDERFHLVESEAHAALKAKADLEPFFTVVPCILMSVREYEALTGVEVDLT